MEFDKEAPSSDTASQMSSDETQPLDHIFISPKQVKWKVTQH